MPVDYKTDQVPAPHMADAEPVAYITKAYWPLKARVEARTKPELVVLLDIPVMKAHRACLLLVAAPYGLVQ